MAEFTPTGRLWLLVGGFGLAFAILAGRLVELQAIAPRQPQEDSADGTEHKVVRPARRGTITDSHGTILAISQLMVTVRADPVKLGTYSPEIARIAAPILEMPEAEVLRRLQPVSYSRTNTVGTTNQGAVSFQPQIETRVRRDNGVVTNLSLSAWETLETTLRKSRFGIETQLSAEKTNILRESAMEKRRIPLWDVATRYKKSREYRQKLRDLALRVKTIRSSAEECRMNGLYPEIVEVRMYPRQSHAAHLLGYTTNGIRAAKTSSRVPVPLLGAAGLEQRFDRDLQGANGLLQSHRAGGRELVATRSRDQAESDGLKVVLNLDANIQGMVEDVLDDGVQTLKPKALSIIVVRPKDGAILALGNRPTYNPNSRRFASMDVLQNRAIMAPAEPGSTFKIVTYSAVLNEGLVGLETPINCEGGTWVPPGIRHAVHDDQGHHLGLTDVEDAFAFSSNVAASKLGLLLGVNRFRQYVSNFGFLSRTGIECAELGYAARTNKAGKLVQVEVHGEDGGAIPRLDPVTATRLPYGYGLFATPLQTCMAAAAIANEGRLMAPRLVQRLENADGEVVRSFPPQMIRQVVRPEAARLMVKAMRRAVVEGTGKPAALDDYEVCGKTGTSRKVDPITREYSSALYYSSFVGFFPTDSPEICIMINADEPTTVGKSYYGGKACAPMFKRLASQIAGYLALPPSAQRTNETAFNTTVPPASTINLPH
jgi:cell division protein FtsI/penicillin-binding protein 2